MSNIKISTGFSQKDLRISDGRKQFWQWDTGCQLTVIGCPDVDQLHYFRKGLSEPMTLNVYESEGKRLCDVPEEILQESIDFKVYAYVVDEDGNCTIFEKTFSVKDRPKPVDYIYTPTEIATVESLVEKAILEAIASGEFKGDKGDKGDKGEDGLSAYEVALDNGFEGSEKEWLASLKGEQGVQGEQGIPGEKGDKGDTGEKGEPGKDGEDGYTPKKGEDYFTPEDKAELTEDISKEVSSQCANAIKATASGEIVRVDDVLPFEHTARVKVSGKNLCPANLSIGHFQLDGYLSTIEDYRSFLVRLKKGVYTVSSDSDIVIIRLMVNGEITSLTQYLAKGSYSFELTKDSEVGMSFRLEPIGGWDDAVKIQLEKGNTATEYEPYIDPTTVTVTRCGDNLLNEDNMTLGSISGSTGENIESSATLYIDDYIPVMNDDMYFNCEGFGSIGISLYAYDKEKNYISNLTFKSVHYPLQQTLINGEKASVAKYVRFVIQTTTKPKNVYFGTNEEYTPYTEIETYTPNADGTVEIPSLSPTMTLLTDTAGAIIDLEYNQDSNVAIGNVKADIRTLDNDMSGLKGDMGDVKTALENIIAIQNSLIGGDAE